MIATRPIATRGMASVTGPALLQNLLMWVFILAPLALALFIGPRIIRCRRRRRGFFFLIFLCSAVGVSLSTLLHIYTRASIPRVFFIAAATFGGAWRLWLHHKGDLSGLGTPCAWA